MEFWGMACRHLAQFFRISVEYNMDPVDFTIKALSSSYKEGIEAFVPQWYSQSPYYYFDEFIEENLVKYYKYKEENKLYEKERMYWLGYCLQDWCNKSKLTGKDIAKIYGENGIKHLIDNYTVYHTVDPMYVLEDTIEIHGLNIDFNEIINT
ncbi:DUF3791 domain-containing protein [Clostridium botulinum]|uniref:hypothetical protein n=1 Tax=unclassified Clostridium TaxID=2614128 RepID=UPI001D52296D|nr:MULTISPECIES: hypothetical protein [unclassified Clostridium]MBN1038795.1 DUF3791 domain-containing protein [Clostridium botulinum]MBN1045662.1 DUF3791 domain-containing protein [Clostridium botulinum]